MSNTLKDDIPVAQNGRLQGKKGGHNALVLALATGRSVPDAARQVGLSTRTVYRRLNSSTFRREIAKARDRMLSEAVGRLLAVSCNAVDALEKNLESKNETIRNRAALGILAHAFKGAETVELAERISILEDRP